MLQILDLLKGSDNPAGDQHIVLKAPMQLWLIGATAAHAMRTIERELPADFPETLHTSIKQAMTDCVRKLQVREMTKG